MNPAEAAIVLSILARVDHRTIGESDAIGWAANLSDVRAEDGRAVADAWYQTHDERPMPKHIREAVKAIRAGRIDAAGNPPTAGEMGIDPDDTCGYRDALYAWRRQVADGADPALVTAELRPRPVMRAIENVFPSPPPVRVGRS